MKCLAILGRKRIDQKSKKGWRSRGVARIFLKGVLSLVSLARQFLQLVGCIVLTSLATLVLLVCKVDIYILTMVNYSPVKNYCTTVSFTFYQYRIDVCLFSFCFAYKNAASKLMYFAMKNRK